MKRIFPSLLSILCIIPLTIAASSRSNFAYFTPTPPPPSPPLAEFQQVENALLQAIESAAKDIPVYLLTRTELSNLKVSSDRAWGLAWLNPVDPLSGEVLPAEPGLALVLRHGDSWQAILPGDPAWELAVRAAPGDILPDDQKLTWLEINQAQAVSARAAAGAVYTGYYLPYRGGETLYVSQTVKHDKYTPSGSAHFAFDFYKPQAMFDIYASKSGYVKQAKDSCKNGSEDCSNWLVVEDPTTSPTTYMLYLHLAQNSIPAELKTIGAPVSRGQFIGVADDTGQSSGHHLHFHVHTYPYSYWGNSVDITFVDVDINGGRPRIKEDQPYCRASDVCQQFRYAYTSGNLQKTDLIPPTGAILSPAPGANITANPITLQGVASDQGSGLRSAQFIANWDGSWVEIGPVFSNPTFSTAWDLCTAGVPDGPLSLALKLMDNDDNPGAPLSGLLHVSVNLACPPPPSCTPSADQVALFSEAGYTGVCGVFGPGSYSTESLAPVGVDNAASLRVGSNVLAALFASENFSGRGETFASDDFNLADNRHGADTAASLRVLRRSAPPGVPAPLWPTAGQVFSDMDSLTLSWDDTGGGLEFQARYTRSGQTTTSPWLASAHWKLGSLAPGSYSWQVKSRGPAGESAWSAPRSFSIQDSAASRPTEIQTVPFNDGMESLSVLWEASSNWDLTNFDNNTPGGSIAWAYDANSAQGYDTSLPNAGHLTSPPIAIPAQGVYYLRFWYNAETEGAGVHWDQRLIQVSADGGPFQEILQLSDDPRNIWLQSPAISLAQYAGKTIHVRFLFQTLDERANRYKGWRIDDFSITSDPPAACGPADSDDGLASARPLAVNSESQGAICPGGDVDFYRFNGQASQRIAAWTIAQASGSPLDTYLLLMDEKGNILQENDDQVISQRTDSLIGLQLPATGAYALKVRAWDHPSAGDAAHTYTLRLVSDSTPPQISWLKPRQGEALPPGSVALSVAASDSGSGVNRVEFLWHSDDWIGGRWQRLGEDWEGADGWSYTLTPAALPAPVAALYAAAVDFAGNHYGLGAWNLSGGWNVLHLPMLIRGH